MSVRKEGSGRRSVKIEVLIPGTPEEVWQAIATGPGMADDHRGCIGENGGLGHFSRVNEGAIQNANRYCIESNYTLLGIEEHNDEMVSVRAPQVALEYPGGVFMRPDRIARPVVRPFYSN